MPQTLPRAIQTKLASARRRLRSVDLALGFARAVLAASLALVVLFSLDTTLQPPLLVLRAFALFVVMVAATGATLFLAKPLRRSLSDDDVALLVEGEYPEFKGGLVSSVQLGRELDREDLYTSRQLIQSTIDRTAGRVDQMDFHQIVRTGPLIPLWTLIAASILLGGMLLRHPGIKEYAGIFYQRVVYGDDVSYPTLVRLRVDLPERTVQVAKGDDLRVDVFVSKGANKVKRLEVHTEYADLDETRDLLKVGADHYRKTYQNVTAPFSFWVRDNEYEAYTGRYQVEVVQRPRVEQYEFVLDYPAYTGKARELVRQPDLQVPIGTEISYLVVANKSLKSSRLIFETKGKAPARGERRRGARTRFDTRVGPAPLSLRDVPAAAFADGGEWAAVGPGVKRLQAEKLAESSDRVLVGKFQVEGDVRFRYELVSKAGLETGKKPVVFTVRAVQDRRPVVTIPTPGRRKLVTPQAKVPVVVEARDDYGIAAVELRLRVLKAETEEPGAVERVELAGVEVGARHTKLNYTLDIADQRLQPGDRLRYLAVAFDHNLDESKKFKESRTYEIQVVRPEDLERILQDRLTALKERLEAAARDQTETRTATEAFVAQLGPKDLLTDDDKRRLQRIEYDQRRVTNRLVDVKKELEEIRDERELNRLTDPGALELVADLHAGARDLAERASPLISRELEDGRAAPRLDDSTRSRLSRVPDSQLEVLEAIQALAARIDKWGDFTEVIQEVRDLLTGEGKIIEGTRKAAKAEHR